MSTTPVITETNPALAYINADPLHGRSSPTPVVPIGTLEELHKQIDHYANDSQIVAAVRAVTDGTCLVELTVQTVDNSAHSTAWLQLPTPPGTRVTSNAADAIPKPTPQLVDGFPRRSRRNCWSEVETLIWSAMQAVEAMPAHPWLTDAVNLLSQAQSRVADFQELTPATVTHVSSGLTGELTGEFYGDYVTGEMRPVASATAPQLPEIKSTPQDSPNPYAAAYKQASQDADVETGKLAHVTTEQLIDYGQQIHRSSTTLLALKPGMAFLVNGKPALFLSRQAYQVTYEQDGVEHTADIDDLPLFNCITLPKPAAPITELPSATARISHMIVDNCTVGDVFLMNGKPAKVCSLTRPFIVLERDGVEETYDIDNLPVTHVLRELTGRLQLAQTTDVTQQDADVDWLGQATVDCLNSALKADPAAIAALIANRIPCNNALADHPFVLVEEAKLLPPGQAVVGAIGLLNGVLAANGLPVVAWVTSDCGGRKLLTGFTAYKQPVAEVQPTPQN